MVRRTASQAAAREKEKSGRVPRINCLTLSDAPEMCLIAQWLSALGDTTSQKRDCMAKRVMCALFDACTRSARFQALPQHARARLMCMRLYHSSCTSITTRDEGNFTLLVLQDRLICCRRRGSLMQNGVCAGSPGQPCGFRPPHAGVQPVASHVRYPAGSHCRTQMALPAHRWQRRQRHGPCGGSSALNPVNWQSHSLLGYAFGSSDAIRGCGCQRHANLACTRHHASSSIASAMLPHHHLLCDSDGRGAMPP